MTQVVLGPCPVLREGFGRKDFEGLLEVVDGLLKVLFSLSQRILAEASA